MLCSPGLNPFLLLKTFMSTIFAFNEKKKRNLDIEFLDSTIPHSQIEYGEIFSRFFLT